MTWLKTIVLIVGGTLLTLACVASATETITYTYDAQGRMVTVVHTGTVNNNVTANYTLDKADNRKNLQVTGAP